MKKVIILGCENSHAETFLKLVQEGAYPHLQVTGVYSHQRSAADKLHTVYGVPVMERYDEAVGQVDGVLITARHGGCHYAYATPYIEKGVVLYVDKPFTIDEGEALDFAQRLEEQGIAVTGGSACREMDAIHQLRREHLTDQGGRTVGGYICTPISLTNEHGGFFFYAQHMVDMVTATYGYGIRSVRADITHGRITVTFHYNDFAVQGLYVDQNYTYYVARAAENGTTGISPEFGTCFERLFDEFYELLQGGTPKLTVRQLIAPVFIMNALYRAMASGKEERVGDYHG